MNLLAWMEQWDMLPPEGGVMLCAVSGGRDSVCLLHYLASIAPQRGFFCRELPVKTVYHIFS